MALRDEDPTEHSTQALRQSGMSGDSGLAVCEVRGIRECAAPW